MSGGLLSPTEGSRQPCMGRSSQLPVRRLEGGKQLTSGRFWAFQQHFRLTVKAGPGCPGFMG